MIERDFLHYYQADATLVSLLGGRERIQVVQAPSTLQMPFLLIAPSGGTRYNITPSFTEETNSVRITLDTDQMQFLKGRQAIERALAITENFRGFMDNPTAFPDCAQDISIYCSPIRAWEGYKAGVFRFQFDATVRFLEPRRYP